MLRCTSFWRENRRYERSYRSCESLVMRTKNDRNRIGFFFGWVEGVIYLRTAVLVKWVIKVSFYINIRHKFHKKPMSQKVKIMFFITSMSCFIRKPNEDKKIFKTLVIDLRWPQHWRNTKMNIFYSVYNSKAGTWKGF